MRTSLPWPSGHGFSDGAKPPHVPHSRTPYPLHRGQIAMRTAKHIIIYVGKSEAGVKSEKIQTETLPKLVSGLEPVTTVEAE